MRRKYSFLGVLVLFLVLFVSGCATLGESKSIKSEKSLSSFENTYWKVTKISGKKVEVLKNMREPYVIFDSTKRRVKGFGGCNNITGAYELKNGSLKIEKLASTRKMCIQVADIENYLLKALKSAKKFEINGEKMKLFDKDEKILGEFEAVYLK